MGKGLVMGHLSTNPVAFVEQLLTQRFFLLPVPEVLDQLHHRAHPLWFRICRDRRELLPQLSFQLYVGRVAPGLTDEVDDGYLPREGARPEDGVRYDPKHTWHHRPRLIPVLHEKGFMDDPLIREFTTVNQRIWMIYHDAAMRFGEGLDSHPVTRNCGFGDALMATSWVWPLRHVLYLPGSASVSKVVGKPHHDRNFVTFHGFQEVGSVAGEIQAGRWSRLPNLPHHLRGFGGILLAKATGGRYDREARCAVGGEIPSLNHRGEGDPSQPTAQRKATVMFTLNEAIRIQ
ncbi:MAG: hypothetical protein P8J32_05455 [bacterium]|nr:hypothetical protein [bacterium]